MTKRTFEFSDGKSNKFWTISLNGHKHTISYGRIGTTGQSQTAEFTSEAEARKSHDRLVTEKLKKGYIEKSADGNAAAAPAAAAAAPSPAMKQSAQPPADVPQAFAGEQKVHREIDLDLAALSYLPSRRAAPQALSPATPFDLEDCLARLRKKVQVRSYGMDWDLSRAIPDRVLAREEAEFWFTVLFIDRKHGITTDALAEMLAKRSYQGRLPGKPQEFDTRYVNPYVVKCLVDLLSPDELRELLLDPNEQNNSARKYCNSIRSGFRTFVLPYLDDAEIGKWQAATRALWGRISWPTNHYTLPPAVFYFGALLGLHDEVRELVEQWPDDLYTDPSWDHSHYHRPQEIVYGLGSPALIAHHFRRLSLATDSPWDISTYLALTNLESLDVVAQSIAKAGKKDDAEALFAAFAHIHAPEAAPFALELAVKSKAPKQARAWLEDNLDEAIVGLIPVAAGTGKLADAAVEFLNSVKLRGHADRLAAHIARAEPAAAARVRARILDVVEEQLPVLTREATPAWWTAALMQMPGKKPKAVSWADPAVLPTIKIGEHALGPDHLTELLGAAQATSLETPHPLLPALRAHAAAEQLDAFGWKLFEGWLADGAPPKEKWAFHALGFLGGDRSVIKLAPLVREWPGESQHQRAVLGLEVLRTIGSDTALMQINGIAQKVKFKGLKERAIQCMEEIAAHRGMNRAQLEDRIVPDCGLDQRGERVFDFGPRQFRFVLGSDLKPMIKYADGARKADLPKPGAKDDTAKAEAAVADWKLLKKQIADVAKIQASRLEQAMVTGRRWTHAELDKFFVHHPLMVHLARTLAWAAYDTSGDVVATFRVTEDQTLADASDQPLTLPPDTEVGILHPLDLADQPRILEQWGQLFGDYEIAPPFLQLGRPVYRLTPEQLAQQELVHFAARGRLPAQSLVFGLEKLGWQRGVPADAGSVTEHSKQFPGSKVTAVMKYAEGFSVGYWEGAEDQTIERVLFVRGLYTPEMYPDHKDPLTLADVDPIVVSEVLGDCELLLAKAK